MKYYKVLLSAIFLMSCNNDNCSTNLDFKLDYHLFESIKINNDSYCDLVNKSFEGDYESITNLSKIQVFDFASYQHGAVMIEIIEKYSEKNYLKIFNNLTPKEKTNFISSITAGIDFYESSNIKTYEDIELELPILIEIVKSSD